MIATDLCRCILTFRNPSEVTDLGRTRNYLHILNWRYRGFLVFLRPNMWLIFYIDLFIVPFTVSNFDEGLLQRLFADGLPPVMLSFFFPGMKSVQNSFCSELNGKHATFNFVTVDSCFRYELSNLKKNCRFRKKWPLTSHNWVKY